MGLLRPLPRRHAAALVLAGILLGVALDLPFLLERRLRARLVREAAAWGFALSVGHVGVRLPLRLVLSDVVVEGHGGGAVAARATVPLRLALHARDAVRGVSIERAVVSLPGDLVLDVPATAWDLTRPGEGEVRLAEAGEAGRIALRRSPSETAIELLGVDLGRLVRVRFGGGEPLRGGTVSASAWIRAAGDGSVRADLVAGVKGIRIAALSDGEEGPRFGAPLDASFAAAGVIHPESRRLELDCLRLVSSGAVLEASGDFAVGEHDVFADGRLSMPRVALADVLATSGIPLATGGGDLGSMALQASMSGHLKDPASLKVTQRLSFTPPAAPPPELAALRGPFAMTLDGPQGEHVADLTPTSPDFVPLEEVPPLFVRTLLISEDAGFWGHPGIDLQEIPVAFATNWSRGETARGASTITQQLAKNLFLSRKKSYGRKLQEVALTLLLESTLGKRRILEIYLNVIEWGPRVYGLKAAARHYFGKEPCALTPREGAFLVAMIPGPMKYQTSIRNGRLSPRFGALVDTLLAKLWSVDALTDEEYVAARAEELAFTMGKAPLPAPVPAE